MATTTGQISWQAFEQLPDGDGWHREVVEGELITLPSPKSRHSEVARRMSRALVPFEDRGVARVYMEAGYKLSGDPATWIQPDVSVLRIERVRATDAEEHFTGSPELAVEVVSPSETARDLNRKIEALLAGGSFAVWVIISKSGRSASLFRVAHPTHGGGATCSLCLNSCLAGNYAWRRFLRI